MTTARIAVPVAGDRLCAHFGQCESFAVFDTEAGEIIGRRDLRPPPHEPGSYPRWLAEQQVTVVLAGGMGGKARDLFAENGIRLVLGVPEQEPRALADDFLQGRLVAGVNFCDH